MVGAPIFSTVVNFIYILSADFSYETLFGNFFHLYATREKVLKRRLYKKLRIKWWNWHLVDLFILSLFIYRFVIHKCKKKCQISSQNESFYLQTQCSRSEIISTGNNEVYLYSQRYARQKVENSCFEVFLIFDVIVVQSDNCLPFSETHFRRNSIQTDT